MEFLNKKQKIIFIVIGTLMVMFIGYYIIKKQDDYKYKEIETIIEEDSAANAVNYEEKIEDTSIIVHVTGAIKKDGIIKVCKLDVDNAPEWAEKYDVMSIPTIIIFNKGNVVNQFVGLTSKEEIEEKI